MVALGTMAGLLLAAEPWGHEPAPAFALLVAAASAWAGSRIRAAGAGPGGLPAVVGFLLLAGLAGGVEAGAEARQGCLAALEDGAPVVAAGTLLEAVPGRDRRSGGRVGRARVRLRGVRLVSGGRSCKVREIRISVGVATPREAGDAVLVHGVWRAGIRRRLPVAPIRSGSLAVDRLERTAAAVRLPLRDRIRSRLASRLERRLPEPAASVARALVLADRSTLEWRVRQSFIDAGIVHLLAISGLHVGLIAGGLVWVLGLRWRGPKRWGMAAGLVAGYVALIGAPAPALRAGLLFSGHAACRCRGRPARTGDLAGAAALLALALDPLVLTDPGFQLSFAGFGGVVAGVGLGNRMARRIRRGHPGLSRLAHASRGLHASVGAFAATAPLAALHFGRVVATSIPASVVATGVVALAIPTVGLTAILPDPIAGLLAPAAALLLEGLLRIADLFARWPLRWTVLDGPRIWVWLSAAGVVGWLGVRRSRRPTAIVVVGLVVAGEALRPVLPRLSGPSPPLVCTMDVGQGDAALVRTGAGRWLVFDAGPGTSVLLPEAGAYAGGRGSSSREWTPGADPRFGDAGRRILAPALRRHRVRQIALFGLSHPHLDHFGGAGALFEGFRVRRVLDPGIPEPSSAYLALLDRAGMEHAAWIRARTGLRMRIDDVTLEVLSPDDRGADAANEGSLVFRLTVRGFRYLNTGDAPAAVERRILAERGAAAVQADLLKLGHHGSRTSSDLQWLRAVAPSVAVISVGAGNRYGHPHPETLARLDSARIGRVWRTDTEGTLCVEVGQQGWRIVPPR